MDVCYHIADRYIDGILFPSKLNTIHRPQSHITEKLSIPENVFSLLSIMKILGIQEPIVHGGYLRDLYFNQILGFDCVPADIDIKATLDRNKFPDNLAVFSFCNLLKQHGMVTRKIEITQSIIIIKFDYELPVDLVLAEGSWNASEVAESGGVSVCSAAMNCSGVTYLDGNFERDALNGIFRTYRPIGQPNLILYQKLNAKFNNYFRTFI